tara:strand:- start:264 stop:566 length:303 start_codon:yes stop_codon:yes gene_type:complete
MKISKKRLIEIIKEEIEEAMFVDASTQRYAGPQYTPKPIDPFADEEEDPSVAKTVPSMRKTQVEDPDEPSSKVAEFIELLAAANLSPAERKELMRQLADK